MISINTMIPTQKMVNKMESILSSTLMMKPEHCSASKKTQYPHQISGHMDMKYHQIQQSELYPK